VLRLNPGMRTRFQERRVRRLYARFERLNEKIVVPGEHSWRLSYKWDRALWEKSFLEERGYPPPANGYEVLGLQRATGDSLVTVVAVALTLLLFVAAPTLYAVHERTAALVTVEVYGASVAVAAVGGLAVWTWERLSAITRTVVEAALVHWPDGTDEVVRVFKRREFDHPLVFAEVTAGVKRVHGGEWELGRGERRAGATEGGRPYELELWVQEAARA
jgi:hypothetical protein